MHVLFIATLFEIVGKGDKHIASEEIPRIFFDFTVQPIAFVN